jgi:hypothetical protein
MWAAGANTTCLNQLQGAPGFDAVCVLMRRAGVGRVDAHLPAAGPTVSLAQATTSQQFDLRTDQLLLP